MTSYYERINENENISSNHLNKSDVFDEISLLTPKEPIKIIPSKECLMETPVFQMMETPIVQMISKTNANESFPEDYLKNIIDQNSSSHINYSNTENSVDELEESIDQSLDPLNDNSIIKVETEEEKVKRELEESERLCWQLSINKLSFNMYPY